MRQRTIILVTLLLSGLVMVGCRSIPQDAPIGRAAAEAADSESPTVKLETIDRNIPLGDTFPIKVNVFNAVPNETITLDFQSDGITPSVRQTTVQANTNGSAQATISGVASREKLAMLFVQATTATDSPADMLFVDFEPQVFPNTLEAQDASEEIGEPVEIRDYFADLPVATTFEEVEAYRNAETPAFHINNVQFPAEEDGVSEPINSVEFHTATVQAQNEPNDFTLSPQACIKESTYITLKLSTDGTTVPVPNGTRVHVRARPSPDSNQVTVVKYVGDNGRVTFDLACDSAIYLTVDGYTLNSTTIGPAGSAVYSWKATIYGTNLTADSVRGDVVDLSDSAASSVSNLALTAWFRINQVFNWERTTPGSPYPNDRFAFDIVYPANDVNNNARSRAAIGQMQIIDSDALQTFTLFHEFGHEVYYRRLIPGATFEQWGRDAVNGNGKYPICPGSLNAEVWKAGSYCAAMLEGFALWFESVATRRLGVSPRSEFQFKPEERKSPTSTNQNIGTVGRVAQYLWDAVDVELPDSSLTTEQRRFGDDEFGGDGIPSKTTSTDDRYSAVARLFTDNDVASSLPDLFRESIWPKLTSDGRINHCNALEFNYIYRFSPCTP